MKKENAIIRMGWRLDNSYSSLPETLFTKMKPVSVRAPRLVALNEPLALELGLDPGALRSEEGVSVLSGNVTPEGSLPLAQAYAGHQFGYFTRLGDGRCILLGEQMTPSGKRVDVQLKGSGKTPYSRGGDGRAALGPMLREYIMSEAMHGLGIPTTRSLSVVATGEKVMRETRLPGAILTRVADSHLRFGTFQFAAQWGRGDELKRLADYALARHYPDIAGSGGRYLALLREVTGRHAALVAKWQLVGFIHGVMNTDNMTISGETIDYGPCAFMDVYDPATVFSSIDIQGRYSYGNQPDMAAWNLSRFAEALLPLIHDDRKTAIQMAQAEVSEFNGLYRRSWLSGIRPKLGLFNEEAGDEELVEDLLKIMDIHQADFTNTFRALTLGDTASMAMFSASDFSRWLGEWGSRLKRQPESREETQELMKRSNPAVIPRNFRVEEALEAAVERNDTSVMERLLSALSDPYSYGGENAEYSRAPIPYGRPYRTYCGT